MRLCTRPASALVLAGWRNIELHAILAWQRYQFFLSIPNLWGESNRVVI